MKNIKPITMHYLRKFLICFILYLFIEFSFGSDILSSGQTLTDKADDFLLSAKETFTLRFFSLGGSANRYLGIQNYKLSENRVVWVANRDSPVKATSGILSFEKSGNLVIYGPDLNRPIWSTSFSGLGKNYSAKLQDTGNLVVFEEDKKRVIVWQSFDHPTDTWLPEMKLGVNRKSGLSWSLRSWKSVDDPGNGVYSFRMDDKNRGLTELTMYDGLDRMWRSGPLNGGAQFIKDLSLDSSINYSYVDNKDEVYLMYSVRELETHSILVVDYSGAAMRKYMQPPYKPQWETIWDAPDGICGAYGRCGPNGNCNTPNTAHVLSCNCLPGSEAKSHRDWDSGNYSEGCVRKHDHNDCRNGEGFRKLLDAEMPDTTTASVGMIWGSKECEKECLKDCNCTAYANVPKMKGACVMWYGDLMDTKQRGRGGVDLFVRGDVNGTRHRAQQHQSSSKKKLKVAAVATPVGVVATFIAIFILFWHRHKRQRGLLSMAEQGPANNLTKELFDANETNGNIQFIDLISLVEATNNFSEENQLGRGGFGTVYKGILKDGCVIAVKRLSKTSQQGVVEFMNEATLVSKLQHINLVRLLGCCAEQNEKILVYEYMPNKSLDSLIFDPEKSSCLDWETRFIIIMGITRGMMYLHHESRVKIVHRDLKASNILLNAQMNPKVSDFGMARFFDNNEVEAITRTVVGTYGYMAPEYTNYGIYSEKSDVYSYGVLLLEIISGRKNNTRINEETMNLIHLAWQLGERALEIIDSSMVDYPVEKVQRCIHIGLLCVQENSDHRPTMSEIYVMLSSERIDLPAPGPLGTIYCAIPPGHASSSAYTSTGVYTSSSIGEDQNDLTCSEIIPR